MKFALIAGEGQNAVMTSVVTERPVSYDPPASPMNSIGEGATPLMYACQQARDQEVRSILSKKVRYNDILVYG